MKLKDLIDAIDANEMLSFAEFAEIEKRVDQLKIYYNIDEMVVVSESISNSLSGYYFKPDSDLYDTIEHFGLMESTESGYVILALEV